MKTILNQYKAEIETNFEENKASALKIKDYLEHSSVAYHGRCVHTLHIPKVFTSDVIAYYKEITATTYKIFEKVIKEYLKNPEYRKQFPFSKELEELILIPNQYASVLPIARFDIFFNEEDWSFKFCEINTDGTSAMNEDYVLNMAIDHNLTHQKMKQQYDFHTFELFDSWVNTFMDLYQTYEHKVENPHIAIIDFLEHSSITEFEEFKRRFEQKGYQIEICEITKLKYKDGVLYSPQGTPIDVIYRRAVTSDIMSHYDQVQDFITAVKEQKVCTIGSFCTQIIHNKWLFKILHEESTLRLMDTKEQEFIKNHIPKTNLMDTRYCSLEEVKQQKDRWIIKPLDSYASRGVYAGTDYSEKEWREIVEKHADHDYIYQEYCPPYRTPNIYLVEADPEWKQYTNMSGIFVYNGEMAGIYSRLSDGGIISSQYNEKAVATLYLGDMEK